MSKQKDEQELHVVSVHKNHANFAPSPNSSPLSPGKSIPSDAITHSPKHHVQPPRTPTRNPFAWLFATWVTPLMQLGYSRVLQPEDMIQALPKEQSRGLLTTFDPYWQQLEQHQKDPKNVPLPNPSTYLRKLILWKWLFSVTFSIIELALQLTVPLFIQQLLIFVKPESDPTRADDLWIDSGIAIAFIIVILHASATLSRYTYEQTNRWLMHRFRSAAMSLIYIKSLKLSGKASREFSQGKIINMVNVDVEIMSQSFMILNWLVSGPLLLIIGAALLVNLMGKAVWAGIGTMIVLLIIQSPLMRLAKKNQVAAMKHGDGRLQHIRELLYAIKIVKLRAWEPIFSDRITAVRNSQIHAVRRLYYAFTFILSIGHTVPIILPIITFVVFTLTGGLPNVVNIFPALLLFSTLFIPMINLPQAVTHGINTYVCWCRIRGFLQASESTPVAIGQVSEGEDDDAAIEIEGAFKWEQVKEDKKTVGKKEQKKLDATAAAQEKAKELETSKDKDMAGPVIQQSPDGSVDTIVVDDTTNTTTDDTKTKDEVDLPPFLTDLNLRIKKGSLTAIVGPVGCGKSSLLSALIGEMTALPSSRVSLHGSVAYCTQQPWIQTDTVRSNILFGQPNDEARIRQAVRVTGLDIDLEELPGGLDTEIGEKGVNVSGGQKARIALARAVYDAADIYLLDDPISALDAHVGAHVFQECILGALKGRTRVLVTHHLHLLRDVDWIVVMGGGQVLEQGRFDDLMAAGGGFVELMKHHKMDDKKDPADEATTDETIDATKTEKKPVVEDNASKAGKGGLIVAEERPMGAVQIKTLKTYVRNAGGYPWLATVILVCSFYQAAQIMNNYCLTWWATDAFGWTNRKYMLVYGLLGLTAVIFAFLVPGVIVLGAYAAAKKIHRQALASLLRAPMSFFDSQPIGRILNRFSKDVDAVDRRIWADMMMLTVSIVQIIGTFILLSVASPYMILFFIPMLVIYGYILRFYRASYRELKRIDSIQRSPLYAHISETLAGIATVRAFRAETRFREKCFTLVDRSGEPYLLQNLAQIWVMSRMELMSSSLVFGLAILGATHVINGPLVGLAFSYAVPLTTYIEMALGSFALLEANMNAMERLDEYASQIPREAPATLPTDPDPTNWPPNGSLTLSDISLSYPTRPLVPVLKNLSLTIFPGEKVGIVGRTGSGKSTLLTALFRLLELDSGSITIDGIDIAKVGLSTLRSSLQIIPQDPVLFTGTIRSNLTMGTTDLSDTQLWDVLELLNLKPYIVALPQKLDSPVTENGENLSVGQRQLLCLARAVLVKPKILVMDEATASVDSEADSVIQRSIQTEFSGTTVLSIAHRINTIIEFDRVVVLDKGRVVESGSPVELLAIEGGWFRDLAEATGAANFAFLKEVAGRRP
ncbi:P-loop containing nucleoside triphosphate hydrolase protein [Phlyctochytrium arcticum]|nr:P-loop containing nucleoside triphosphate hydrolase protein [Phlyctochytrium arcticum]